MKKRILTTEAQRHGEEVQEICIKSEFYSYFLNVCAWRKKR